MNLRTQVSVLALVFLVSLSSGMAITANAHTASDWYPAKWGSNHLTVEWRFASNVPSGNTRERAKDGARQWNNLGQTMSFNFEQNQSDYSSFSATSCPSLANVEKDAVHWGPIDGALGFGATTLICTFQDAGGSDNNSLHSFQIKIDSQEAWYTGVGTPTSQQVDLWSVMAHEFGHATGRGATAGGTATVGGDGLGHFLNSVSLCNQTDSEHHTMCKSYILGSKYDRTLNTHDSDTFNNAY